MVLRTEKDAQSCTVELSLEKTATVLAMGCRQQEHATTIPLPLVGVVVLLLLETSCCYPLESLVTSFWKHWLPNQNLGQQGLIIDSLARSRYLTTRQPGEQASVISSFHSGRGAAVPHLVGEFSSIGRCFRWCVSQKDRDPLHIMLMHDCVETPFSQEDETKMFLDGLNVHACRYAYVYLVDNHMPTFII